MKINFLFLFVIIVLLIGCKKVHEDESPSNMPKDFDGNIYSTVTIGTQTWTVENLRTSRYSNGDPIIHFKNDEIPPYSPDKAGAWTSYKDDTQNDLIFGKYYNWFAASDSRNICPKGWRVASASDWEQLINFLGGEEIAGGKLKSTEFWEFPNGEATNETGFSALPGFITNLVFERYGYLWSSTANADPGTAKCWTMNSYDGKIKEASHYRGAHFCIRCIKE